MVADELITAAELKSLIGTDKIRVVDAREPEAYREGHIPGAMNLHPSVLEHTERLEGGGEVEHQLKPVEEIAAFLRAAGIRNSVPVCVYDEGGGYLAARVWWILDYVGHERPRLLDGGLDSWSSLAGDLSTDAEPFSPGDFVISPQPNRRLEFSDVIANLGDERTILVNSLPSDWHRLESIPDSINIPYTEAFADDNHPLLKSRHELAAMFAKHGITADHRLICYCQIGYSASLLYLAARYAGLAQVSLYDGSKLDWVARGGGLVFGD